MKDLRQEKGTTEDEIFGWDHQLYGHEFEQAPVDSERRESLACCSPWDHEESDTTWRLNNNKNTMMTLVKRTWHQFTKMLYITVNIYAIKSRESKYRRQTLMELQGETNKSTILFGDFSILLLEMERSSRNKICKAIS